jgi:hypothetical protein
LSALMADDCAESSARRVAIMAFVAALTHLQWIG